MTDEERKRLKDVEEAVALLKARQLTGGIYATIAGKALQGEQPSEEDLAQAKALLGLS